jgi:ubiquinone/menaquinone biosynthesis C-methylase UbiE
MVFNYKRLIVGGIKTPGVAGRKPGDLTLSLASDTDVVGDASKLPFKDSTFEEIAFEFLPLDLFTSSTGDIICQPLQEAWRVLKNHGLLRIYTGLPPTKIDCMSFSKVGFSQLDATLVLLPCDLTIFASATFASSLKKYWMWATMVRKDI